MQRRSFLKITAGVSAGALAGGLTGKLVADKLKSDDSADRKKRPNVVIIFTDDQGYADASCYGAKGFKTPNIDKLAADGIKFTDFYVAASVCTPSRAALLTASYPKRVGLHRRVLFAHSKTGLNPSELTIAKFLKPLGYKTACIGKWHLGHYPKFMPNNNGFDYFYGLPYSNDMNPEYLNRPNFPKLPLYENGKVLEYQPSQALLTRNYTTKAVKFINENKDKPFLLYLPHSMPHMPWAASDKFRKSSKRGLYGDVIQEIDWSVGQVLKALKKNGLDENTLVIFTSDNGPIPWMPNGGQATPLRGFKGTSWEGGQREIGIARWKGTVPAGKVASQLVTAMDVLPTLAAITGKSLPKNIVIDGKNILPILKDPDNAKSPYEAFFYYSRLGEIEAVRKGKWKLHIAKERMGKKERKTQKFPALYDLSKDIGERNNLADKHPGLVKKLTKLIKDFDADLTKNARPVGTLDKK